MQSGEPLNRSFFSAVACVLIAVVSGFFRALGWRACRFYPTCSVYARQAFREENFFKALGLSVRRVLRCHPFSEGGYDPVHSSIKRKH